MVKLLGPDALDVPGLTPLSRRENGSTRLDLRARAAGCEAGGSGICPGSSILGREPRKFTETSDAAVPIPFEERWEN